MAQQFIEHLPGGHPLKDVLPSALEVLKKQVNEQGLKFTAEISLKEVFSRIDREWGAVHSRWYVQAYEECMLCAQGDDELLIDYVQRVERLSLRTQSSKNVMYRHTMRDVKEQASLRKNLNSVMGKMIFSGSGMSCCAALFFAFPLVFFYCVSSVVVRSALPLLQYLRM